MDNQQKLVVVKRGRGEIVLPRHENQFDAGWGSDQNDGQFLSNALDLYLVEVPSGHSFPCVC